MITTRPRPWGKYVDRALGTVKIWMAIVKRSGHRRCVRDYERLPEHHEAMVRWSVIRITGKRVTKQVQERILKVVPQ